MDPADDRSGTDPRLSPQVSDDLIVDDLAARPSVGAERRPLSNLAIVLVFAVLGIALLLWLNARREAVTGRGDGQTASAGPAAGQGPAPLELPADAGRAGGPMFAIPAPQFTTSNAAPPPPSSAQAVALAAPPLPLDPLDPSQRRRAPALVVDLGGSGEATPLIPNPALVPAAAAKPALPAEAAGAETAANALSAEERFADRVGQGEVEKARATTLRNLDSLIPQGAIIPAVLETAINSDLPGFTRAVVSRDVMSFDGRNVLIPRGSRLIGQYKSGIALGASRVFVIWTRVIRLDGGSIQIGSPGTDPLGRGGVGGSVDRHFFQRFGGSILLSVMNAGLTALANSGRSGSQIYIASPTDASNVAAQALQKDGGTSPTIKTPQGAPISIFVARDLDFTGVGKPK